ncbi:MAG: hypothetical protein K1564_19350 [Candidatus Thiodiazotropha sp. (ex. Lucinisca nassula)]|nr:hypothetical protein [Candidatus Thiodiazotropha sp. (ex. Lucinisca nassula)]
MTNCKAITTKGKPCSRPPIEGAEYCWQHQLAESPSTDDEASPNIKQKSNLPDNQIELAKVLVEQYKALTQGIVQRVEQQQKLLYFQLIFIGILVAIYARNPTALLTHDSVLVLLLTPLILMYFVMAHSRHDFMIISYARFIAHEIWPNLQGAIDSRAPSWEQYLASRRQKYALPLSIFGSEYGLPLILCLLLLPFSFWVVYSNGPICFSFAKSFDASRWALGLVIVEIILFILVLKLRLTVMRDYGSIPEQT